MATPTATLDSITNIGGFGSTVSSVVVSIPATTNSYDHVALVIAVRQKTATISMPANWESVTALSHTNGNGRVAVWKRVGIFSAGNITISWSSAVNGKIAVLKVNGQLDDCDIAEAASYGSTIAGPSSTSVSTETRAVHVATTSKPAPVHGRVGSDDARRPARPRLHYRHGGRAPVDHFGGCDGGYEQLQHAGHRVAVLDAR